MADISKYIIALTTVLVCSALPHSMARTNDSSAAIGLGGLELVYNDTVSMDSKEFFLSMERARVTYQFTNRSDRDVRMLVSFPLPDIPDEISGHLGDRTHPDWRELHFRTLVNGEPVELSYRLVASADDKIYRERPKDTAEQYVETFLNYHLSPGANWQGPIGKFRLVINKEKSSNLLGVCMDDIWEISPA